MPTDIRHLMADERPSGWRRRGLSGVFNTDESLRAPLVWAEVRLHSQAKEALSHCRVFHSAQPLMEMALNQPHNNQMLLFLQSWLNAMRNGPFLTLSYSDFCLLTPNPPEFYDFP